MIRPPALDDSSNLPISELLYRVRDVLFEKGWNQGSKLGSDGSLCLSGAIEKVCNGSWNQDYYFIYEHLQQAIPVTEYLRGRTPPEICSWNDVIGRTLQEVFDLIDRAIELSKVEYEAKI